VNRLSREAAKPETTDKKVDSQKKNGRSFRTIPFKKDEREVKGAVWGENYSTRPERP